MALFLSTYVNKIDKKGRVSIPASFRAVLSGENFNGIVVYPSFINSCVEACGMNRVERLSASIDRLDPFSEERDAFATSILSNCVELGFDGEGRVHLPESLLDIMELAEKAMFVGKGMTFEIWEPDAFAVYAEKARNIAKAKRDQLQLLERPNGERV